MYCAINLKPKQETVIRWRIIRRLKRYDGIYFLGCLVDIFCHTLRLFSRVEWTNRVTNARDVVSESDPHHDAKICRNVWLLASLGLSRYIWPMEFIVSLSMKNLNNCLREWYVKEAVDQPHNRESGTTRLYTILHMIWTSQQNGSAILNSVEPSKPRITERWENGMAETIATMLYSLRVS